MKNEEILKKAIDKATANGFIMDNHKHFCEIGRDILTGEIKQLGAYQSIIFDHDFAKAFWGEKNIKVHDEFLENDYGIGKNDICPTQSAWSYHLTKMVLEEDPILYLEKYL